MKPISIEEIIERLEPVQYVKHSTVQFDFCNTFPSGIGSWRGVYAEPSVGFEVQGMFAKPPTVKQFLDMLHQLTDGRTFEGWKGGNYIYNRSQMLHVDNPGECSGTYVVDVVVERYEDSAYVKLMTYNGESDQWWGGV